jgi:hypothetical protein
MKYRWYGRSIWYAWYPVQANCKTWVWLEKVWRVRNQSQTYYETDERFNKE